MSHEETVAGVVGKVSKEPISVIAQDNKAGL
jgi:hypothetical protein